MSADRAIDEVSYLAGRGPAGMPELRARVEAACGAEWVRRIPLAAAVMRGHVQTSLRFLVEEVGVDTVNVLHKGLAPLHIAVIWGRTDCAAYLLAHAADPGLACDRGETPVEKARLRQQRLEGKLAEDIPWLSDGSCIGKRDISRMCAEGVALVRLLEGVEAAGSYRGWVRQNPASQLARRYPPRLAASRPEFWRQLALLRALVAAGRAELRPPGQGAGAAGEEAPADAIAHSGGATAEDLPEEEALEAAMLRAGVGDLTMRLQEHLGPFGTLADLAAAQLTRQEVQKLDCKEADQRRLWRFLVDLQQSQAEGRRQPPRGQQDGKTKAKKAASPRARAALLASSATAATASKGRPAPPKGKAAAAAALAPQGSASAAAAAAAAAAGPRGQDRGRPDTVPREPAEAVVRAGLRLLFHPDLPLDAFVHVAAFLLPPARPKSGKRAPAGAA